MRRVEGTVRAIEDGNLALEYAWYGRISRIRVVGFKCSANELGVIAMKLLSAAEDGEGGCCGVLIGGNFTGSVDMGIDDTPRNLDSIALAKVSSLVGGREEVSLAVKKSSISEEVCGEEAGDRWTSYP